MIRFSWVLMTLLIPYLLTSQTTVSIAVADNSGSSLAGVAVLTSDSQCVTDSTGLCGLLLAPGRHKITIQSLGYQILEKHIEINTVPQQMSFRLERESYDLQEIELIGSWIDEDEPFTYQSLNSDEINRANIGVDVPYLLQWLPGAVVTSDAGTGIGYTGYRIRGSDPSRINVTIDGIPLNDSESQGVFWVNMPDFASSVDGIQVQRGVGTSTNGAGAFGGSISLQTKDGTADPYLKLDASVGSFATRRSAISFGTGRLGGKLSLDGRASLIRSDGYIDRGSSDLHSLMISANYLTDHSSFKLNAFTGKEITYQAWNGVPVQYVQDSELRKTNTVGLRADGSYHPDEVDNYRQTHVHATWKSQLSNRYYGTIALHYTKGKGYFEQYRIGDDLDDYGIDPVGQATESDLIRRRWLDNDFGGFIFTLRREDESPFNWQIGGGYNTYLGGHFGEVIWADVLPQGHASREYYRNDATKHDLNLYAQATYTLRDRYSLFGDMQWRRVDYDFSGFNADLQQSDQSVGLDFFNPKIGVSGKNNSFDWYYSFAVGHREPNRDDYVNSSPASRPLPEVLYDHELGIRFGALSVNGFYMAYRDQLVLTGVINDVGENIRANVPDSYRLGIELDGQFNLGSAFTLMSNVSLSSNRIRDYVDYVDDWDTGTQLAIARGNSTISFSPSAVLYMGAAYDFLPADDRSLFLIWHHKYVGKQYLDNSGSADSQLDGYYYSDLEAVLDLPGKLLKNLQVKLQVRNVFAADLITNGWIYRYKSDGYDGRPDDPHTRLQDNGLYNLTGLYPQAFRNLLLGVVLDF